MAWRGLVHFVHLLPEPWPPRALREVVFYVPLRQHAQSVLPAGIPTGAVRLFRRFLPAQCAFQLAQRGNLCRHPAHQSGQQMHHRREAAARLG